MVDAWPADLPQYPLLASYQSAVADGRIRAEVSIGPAKIRRRTTANIRPLTADMECTAAQLSSLRTFVDTTVAGGSMPFTFPSPEGGSDLLVRFDKDGMPAWKPNGDGTWIVSFKLEVLP